MKLADLKEKYYPLSEVSKTCHYFSCSTCMYRTQADDYYKYSENADDYCVYHKKSIEFWMQEKADTIKAMENMDGVGVVNNQGYSQYDVMGDYLDYIEEQLQELKEAQ